MEEFSNSLVITKLDGRTIEAVLQILYKQLTGITYISLKHSIPLEYIELRK